MANLLYCTKLKKEAEGLEFVPFPGELGMRIATHISAEAWGMWVAHQTMLINEYRLSTLEAKDRDFLMQEMEKFLFGTGSDKPSGYKDPDG